MERSALRTDRKTFLCVFTGIFFALFPIPFCSVLAPLHASPAKQAVAESHAVALKGGTLIDGTGKSPLNNAVVVIRGNRIETVGSEGQVRIPDGAQIVNTSGKFILPGLIDSHFHYAPWMVGDLPLAFGQTSLFHFGPRIEKAIPPSDEVRTWPRIFYSGRTVATPQEVTLLGPVQGKGTIQTPEEARELVKQNKQSGASFITVNENLPPELLAAAIGQAHSMGLAVIGHQTNAADAVGAGLDGVEHMTGLAFACITDPKIVERLSELQKKGPTVRAVSHPISNPEYYVDPGAERKMLRLMVDRHAFLNPTMTTRWQRVEPRTHEFYEEYERMSEAPQWQFIPENVRKSWLDTVVPYPESTDPVHKRQEQVGYRKAQEFLRDFTKAGGKIFSGTDFSYSAVMGLRLHQELLLLVDAGLTPMQAILTATRYPAELIHIDKDLGTVEPGKLADIIVVDEDPLQRIQNLKKISRVILDGKIIPTRFRPDSIDSPEASKRSR